MQCPECGKVFSTKFNLSRHVSEHSSSNPHHVCCKCSKAFKRRDNLQRHIRDAHKEKVSYSFNGLNLFIFVHFVPFVTRNILDCRCTSALPAKSSSPSKHSYYNIVKHVTFLRRCMSAMTVGRRSPGPPH